VNRFQRLRGIGLPACLAAVGVWLLAGCIYIPTFSRVTAGKNVADKVGDEESNKPLSVGHVTRDDVHRLLGEPDVAKRDGSAVAYTWNVQNGFVIWPLCFQAHAVNGARSLVLRFGPDGRLASYQVLKDDDNLIDLDSHGIPLPADIEEEQYERAFPNLRITIGEPLN
jgi:hypothetical protein